MLFYKCVWILLFLLLILYYYNTKININYNYQNMYNLDNSFPVSILKINNIKSNKRVHFFIPFNIKNVGFSNVKNY